MTKKVNIGSRPTKNGSDEKDLEKWVSHRGSEPTPEPTTEPKEKTKRFTLDVSETLHRNIKKKAADEGVAMADLLREILEKHFN